MSQPSSSVDADPVVVGDEETTAARGLKPDALAAGISIMLLLTVGQRLIGFLRQVLVCRFLSPEDLGLWNLSFSMIILLAPLLVLGLPGTFGRYAEYYRHRGQVRSFFYRTLGVTALLTLIGCAALAFAAGPSAWLIYSDRSQAPLVMLLVPTILSVIAFNVMTEMMSSLRQVKLVAYMRFGHAMAFSLTALAMVVYFQGTTQALIASYAIASLLTCCAAAVPILRAWRSMSDTTEYEPMPLWSKLLPFAGWIWLSDLLSNLFAAADRYMMIHLMHGTPSESAAVIGQYHSSRIVPQLLIAVALLIGTSILPYLSNDWESGRKDRVSDRLQSAIKGFAIMATLGGLFIMLISPWLFGEVMGGKYAAGLVVLPMTLLYCTCYGLVCIAQDFLFCCEKGGHISIALGLGLILNVVLNFLMVPAWGLVGGVLATVIANSISLGALYWLNAREGLQWQTGTILATALPCTFLLPASVGVPVVGVALYLGIKRRVLLSSDELAFVSDSLHRITLKLFGTKFAWTWPKNTLHKAS